MAHISAPKLLIFISLRPVPIRVHIDQGKERSGYQVGTLIVMFLARGFLPAGAGSDLSHGPDHWERDGDGCTLQSVAKGQEFVATDLPPPLVMGWIRSLLRRDAAR